MPLLPLPRRRANSSRGVALIIVLAFVVLLTGVVVALLSRALSERQISNSSANQTRADIFAQGAADTILGDLEQEIVAGSVGPMTPPANATPTPANTLPTSVTLYVPTAPINAVPAQAVSASTTPSPTTLPNLLKRSARGVPFYPATSYDANAKTRAAAVSTLTSSQNGRTVSPARWNKALLLPKLIPTSNTDFTPVGATAATAASAATWTYAPDWVLVARDGSNPTAWNQNMVSSAATSSAVVGRYGYMIYNEGGLLDANVAGYPAGAVSTGAASPNVLPQYKGAASYADLTQLTSAGGGALLTQTQIDQLVGWRNYASAGIDYTKQPPVSSGTSLSGNFPSYAWTTASATNYFQSIFRNNTGFLKTLSPVLINQQTDKGFTSRQELINLFQAIAGTSTATAATMQNALQYLGTFSRGLSQPSYVPLNGRPKTTTATGSNSAAGSDDLINPSFLAARVITTVPGGRNDGTDLIAGDPLVKKRFALNRLAWLTYAGPITTNGTSYVTGLATSYTNALKSQYGFTDAFLYQGTPANIYKYFGLTWVPDTRGGSVGDGQYKWVYNHTALTATNSFPTTSGVAMKRLADGTANDVAHAGREPDFFELLKAAVAVGSKAKPATLPTSLTSLSAINGNSKNNGPYYTTSTPETIQNTLDSTLELATIQLGANIIDQFDLDGFPTRILYNSPVLPAITKELAGVENLPYFYGVRDGFVQGRAPVGMPYQKTGSSPTVVTTAGSLTDTGYAVLMQFPEVWNPHDANSPRCARDASGNLLVDGGGKPLCPTSFRLVADSVDPDHITNDSLSPTAITLSPNLFNNSGLSGGYLSGKNCDWSYMMTPPAVKALPFTASTQMASNAFALYAENTALTFTINETSNAAGKDFFREPTMLVTPNMPVGSTLQAGGSANMLSPTAMYANVVPGNHANIKSSAYMDTNTGAVLGDDGNEYLGIYLAVVPAAFYYKYNNTSYPELAVFPSQWDASAPGLYQLAVTYRVQYDTGTINPPPTTGPTSSWATYDSKYCWALNQHDATTYYDSSYKQMPGTVFVNTNGGEGGITCYDPRTSRFGSAYGGSAVPPGDSLTLGVGTTGSSGFPSATYPFTPVPYGWLDTSHQGLAMAKTLTTARPDISSGYALNTPQAEYLLPAASGWSSTSSVAMGLLSQNSTTFAANGKTSTTASGGTGRPTSEYYSDPDSVVRRATGAYVSSAYPASPPTSNGLRLYYGLPLATANTSSGSTTTESAQLQSRPIVLNRPFQTVAELGYTFSGTPWKNIDFFTVESGDSPLLDVFSVSDNSDATGMVAGQVDLNTRQTPVIQAIVAGAYKDEQINSVMPPTWTTQTSTQAPPLTTAEATAVANALVARTANTPLTNLAELVGRYGTASSNATIQKYDTQMYDGFANDLTVDVNSKTVFGESTATSNIERFREAPIRALAASGQTRVWNLLVDVVAQTGRYSSNANSLPQFIVEGEQRYWVHVAIDRYTGQVIDKRTEIVKE